MADEPNTGDLAGQVLALNHSLQSLFRVLTREQKIAFATEIKRFHEPGLGDAYHRVIGEMNRNVRV